MQNQVYLINSDQEQFKKENSSDVAVDKVPGRGTVVLPYMLRCIYGNFRR